MSLREVRQAGLRHIALAVARYYGIPEEEFFAGARARTHEIVEARRTAALVILQGRPDVRYREIGELLNLRWGNGLVRAAYRDHEAVRQAEKIMEERIA